MQEVNGVLGGSYYEFKYIEKFDKIIVWKGHINENGVVTDFKQRYIMQVIRKPRSIVVSCNCPSGRYRKYCKHEDFVKNEFDFNKTKRPRTLLKKIAEQYYEEWLEQNKNL